MLYGELTLGMIIMRIIEGFAQIFLLSSIMHKKLKKREYVISVTLIVVLFEIFYKAINHNYITKLIMIILIVVSTVSIVCRINVYKVFLGYVITTLLISIVDLISGTVLLFTLDISTYQEISTVTEYHYLAMLIMDLLLFITALTIRYFKMTFTDIDHEKRDMGIAFNVLLTLLFIFPSLVLIVSYIENRPLSIPILTISIISMLAVLILSIFNSQKRYNLLISQQELESEKNYNTILQSLVDSLRTFKHDYNNTLSTLYGYVQLGDMKSLKRMFKEILEESRQISTLDKLNPNLIKDPNMFGLVTSKYQTCIKKNITMDFEILSELNNIEIKTFDLTRIIGIFLDNAIEAASGSKEKKINLLISEDEENVIIEISNTYSDKEISVEKIFEKGISSKGENRGLGLYKVKEIVKKYSGVELDTTIDDNMFMQKLTIEKMVN